VAPSGQDTLIGIAPVGHLDETGEQDWRAIRERARQAILKRLAEEGLEDLEDRIKFELRFRNRIFLCLSKYFG
jgi:hypothetical protein